MPNVTPAGAATTATPTSQEMVQQIIQDINAERAARGLPVLSESTSVDTMEQQITNAQAAGTIPAGDHWPTTYQQYGFQSGTIVAAWDGASSGSIVYTFMNSTPHRDTLMTNIPGAVIGAGVTCGGPDVGYVQVGMFTTSSASWEYATAPPTPVVTNPQSGAACPDPIVSGGGGSSTGSTFPNPSYPVVGMAANGSSGYWLANSGGQVWSYGSVGITNISTNDSNPTVGIAATSTGNGLAVVDTAGHVYTYGDMNNYGQVTWALNRPVLGITLTPDDQGYWLVAADGGIFSFGDAHFYGSTGNLVLNKPVVGMTVSPDGGGYRLVASDGGIFSFGDAPFYGSMGGKILAQPVVGMAPTADNKGYWMVAADGGIFSFGDAPFWGAGIP